MADNVTFDSLKEMSSQQLREGRRNAEGWLKDRIQEVRGKRRFGQTEIFERSSVPEIGGMYLFAYDPKWKHKLPFYDVFPLVIPIEFYNNGFLGLNLHYLPEMQRSSLLENLSNYTNNDRFDKHTKMNISYNFLNKYSRKFEGYQDCLKRYLFSHVRSSFHKVDPAEWNQAALLPLQKFESRNPGFRAPY